MACDYENRDGNIWADFSEARDPEPLNLFATEETLFLLPKEVSHFFSLNVLVGSRFQRFSPWLLESIVWGPI